jgi:deoxyribonuclease V
MMAAVDAQYSESDAAVACVSFPDWSASVPDSEHATLVHSIEPYAPGEFWRRELPCILRILEELPREPDVILIDGYVWLDGMGRKGLGAHLDEALSGRSAVVGIAKHPFRGASNAAEVLRGRSERPLYVTSEGIPLDVAVRGLSAMVGQYRVPTLLKRVDQLARETLRRSMGEV